MLGTCPAWQSASSLHRAKPLNKNTGTHFGSEVFPFVLCFCAHCKHCRSKNKGPSKQKCP